MLAVGVRSRGEPELKREVAADLKAAGLDVSMAIRLFLRSVVERVGLPMELPRAPPSSSGAVASRVRQDAPARARWMRDVARPSAAPC